MAHDRISGARFSDPTAFALLPDDVRVKVERSHSAAPPAGWRERLSRFFLDRHQARRVPAGRLRRHQ